jgi:hypothetical protein
MKTILIFILAALSNLPSPSHASEVLGYEPVVVSLRGTISLQDFAGPPNYENVARGDRLERAWILHLKNSVRVVATLGDELSYTQDDVREVQLLCGEDCGKKVYFSEGKEVTLVGTLFSAHTGHHHKGVLMNVLSEK